MMDPTVLLLMNYFLFVVQSAPAVSSDPTFTDVTERAQTLVQKVLGDIPAAHAAAVSTRGLTLESNQPTTLLVMSLSLGLPAPPQLKPPSEHFTLDVCVSRMLAGCQMYQRLLAQLNLEGLMELKVTLRDLVTHIAKMKDMVVLDVDAPDALTPDISTRLQGNYEAQVAAHLTLIQLRSFCHDLSRSLRAISSYRPGAA